MIKAKGRSAKKASVTFTLSEAVGAHHAALCGEWNDWSPDREAMELVDGAFSRTVELEVGRNYRFRYLLDGHRWENDWDADFYVPNDFGGEDSVVDLTAFAEKPPAAKAAPVKRAAAKKAAPVKRAAAKKAAPAAQVEPAPAESKPAPAKQPTRKTTKQPAE
jgi:hypothetical protein